MTDYAQYIEDHTLRIDASGRGGGIEIDCNPLFKIEGAKMSAYQNYLGGGMLGAIQANANFEPRRSDTAKFERVAIELKRYFHNLTNHEGDEWEEQSFEQNQNMLVSAY